MGQSSTKTQYRKFYKKYYKIDFSNDYVVHHIDGNRDNNNIENLVMLPKALHTKYHILKTLLENEETIMQSFPTKIVGNCVGPENYHRQVVHEFEKVLDECNKWFDYKMFLEQNITNGLR